MKTRIERLVEAGIEFVVCCMNYKNRFSWFILLKTDEGMRQYEFGKDELRTELWGLLELHKKGLFRRTATDSGHLIYRLA